MQVQSIIPAGQSIISLKSTDGSVFSDEKASKALEVFSKPNPDLLTIALFLQKYGRLSIFMESGALHFFAKSAKTRLISPKSWVEVG